MTFQDAALTLTAGETKLVLSFAALCVGLFIRMGWMKAKAFEDVAKRTQAIDQALHGDPEVPVDQRNGLVKKFNHVATKVDTLASHFEKHVTDEAAQVIEGNRLRNEANNKLHLRLTSIEDKLPDRRRKAR